MLCVQNGSGCYEAGGILGSLWFWEQGESSQVHLGRNQCQLGVVHGSVESKRVQLCYMQL